MSLAAVAWVINDYERRGNEGWVMLSLCDAADDNALAGLSKKTLARQTRLSETTVWRTLQILEALSDIVEVAAEDAPPWWLSIRADRRPKLYRLAAFAGFQSATSRGDGVATGSRIPPRGVATGSRPKPVTSGDATRPEDLRDNPVIAGARARLRDPDPSCVRCWGAGEFYNATAGVAQSCPCASDPRWRPPPPRATIPFPGLMPARRDAR